MCWSITVSSTRYCGCVSERVCVCVCVCVTVRMYQYVPGSTVQGANRILCMVRGALSEVKGTYDVTYHVTDEREEAGNSDNAEGEKGETIENKEEVVKAKVAEISIALQEQKDNGGKEAKKDIARYTKQFEAEATGGKLLDGQPRLCARGSA